MKAQVIVIARPGIAIEEKQMLDYLFECSVAENTDPDVPYHWTSMMVTTQIDEPDLGGQWSMAAFELDITPAIPGLAEGLHVLTLTPVGEMPLIPDVTTLQLSAIRFPGEQLESLMYVPSEWEEAGVEIQAFTYKVPELGTEEGDLFAYLTRDIPEAPEAPLTPTVH